MELMGNSFTNPVDPRRLAVELLRKGPSAKGSIAQVSAAVNAIRSSRQQPAIPLHVVPAGDQQMQARVEALMTEDRTAATVNYREFLLEVQRRVAQGSSRK